MAETVYTEKIAWSGSNIQYVGKTQSGIPGSAPYWQIKKITFSGGNPTDVQWAGRGEFKYVWDDRETLIYK